MNKVKIPKEVAEAIEQAKNSFSDFGIISLIAKNDHKSEHMKLLRDWVHLNSINQERLMKALVNGYEVEMTPEQEAIQYLIENNMITRGHSEHDVVMAIKSILNR